MVGPSGFELVIIAFAYLIRFVLPILLVIAAVLVIARMIGGVKVRGLSRKGEQAVADAAARAVEEAVADTGAEGSGDVVRAEAELLRARVELALADAGLTKRERTVLLEMRDGKTQAELAEELGVTRSTVGTYCTRAYEKLGATSKEDAAGRIAHIEAVCTLRGRGLTERKAEVAAFAADGMSDAEIAAKLVVSAATVGSHLQQAYTKLGVHSRTELNDFLRTNLSS